VLLLLLSFNGATYVPGQEKGKRQEKASNESALVDISPTERLYFLPYIYAMSAVHEHNVSYLL
jgi:hypothetical protein